MSTWVRHIGGLTLGVLCLGLAGCGGITDNPDDRPIILSVRAVVNGTEQNTDLLGGTVTLAAAVGGGSGVCRNKNQTVTPNLITFVVYLAVTNVKAPLDVDASLTGSGPLAIATAGRAEVVFQRSGSASGTIRVPFAAQVGALVDPDINYCVGEDPVYSTTLSIIATDEKFAGDAVSVPFSLRDNTVSICKTSGTLCN